MRNFLPPLLALLALSGVAQARDLEGRFVNSPLKPWFDQLKSSGGSRCCSDADGTAVSDVDWETKDNHYRVRINGSWFDVPPEAVITEPNRAGRAMVWPFPMWNGSEHTFGIRCFMPGSMT